MYVYSSLSFYWTGLKYGDGLGKAPRVQLRRVAKAGPPQLEPLPSLLEREPSDSTEQQGKSTFSSFIRNKNSGVFIQGIALSVYNVANINAYICFCFFSLGWTLSQPHQLFLHGATNVMLVHSVLIWRVSSLKLFLYMSQWIDLIKNICILWLSGSQPEGQDPQRRAYNTDKAIRQIELSSMWWILCKGAPVDYTALYSGVHTV